MQTYAQTDTISTLLVHMLSEHSYMHYSYDYKVGHHNWVHVFAAQPSPEEAQNLLETAAQDAMDGYV